MLFQNKAKKHELRGSASPMLTAMGLSMGSGQFDPLRKRQFESIAKIFVAADYIDLYSTQRKTETVTQLLQIGCKRGFVQMGEIEWFFNYYPRRR